MRRLSAAAQLQSRSPSLLPGLEQPLAQRRGFGGGHEELVAQLAAEADAPDHQLFVLEDMEVLEGKHRFLADQAREGAAAGGPLQGEDGEGARGVVAAVVLAADR